MALGLWLPSWLLWWPPECPRRDAGQGSPGKSIRRPCCGTTARADDEAGTSTKRDLDSYKKKGFSLSSCFADHHYCCCRMKQGPPQHRGPAVCGDTEPHPESSWGNRPKAPAQLCDFPPTKQPPSREGLALQTWAEEPIPGSASPWPTGARGERGCASRAGGLD